MKLVCSKSALLNGVQIVSKAVPNKTTMSILECILVDASRGVITLTANDMENRAHAIFQVLPNYLEMEKITDCVVVSHGMLIRYLYHYLTGNKEITPFKVINSEGFTFSNLDLLVYDTTTKEIEVHRYEEPISHFAK